MATSKHFFQDRTALLLVSVNSFLALLSTVLILLKINATRGTVNYIVSYRQIPSIDRYTVGTIWDVLSFIAAAALLYTLAMVLAYRTYKVRRELSLLVLGVSVPLLCFLLMVSNALLVLR